jgi:photosystem II stability/assembly factor-like uncharacterized protein
MSRRRLDLRRLAAARSRVHRSATCVAELLEPRQLLTAAAASDLPDLTPYQPPGWADKILLTTNEGDFSNSTNFSGQSSLFVHAGVINQGTSPTGNFTSQTFIDGVKLTAYFSGPVNPGDSFYYYAQDVSLRGLRVGTHTISITLDYGKTVAESDETNNTYSRTFVINSPFYPDFIPYQPPGWSDKIVVSTRAGTNTDAPFITTDDTLYIDYDEYNQGGQFNNTTYRADTRVLLDGEQVSSFFVTSQSPSFYFFKTDAIHAPVAAGVHTLTVQCDYLGGVPFEDDKSNNNFTRTFTVVAAEQLPTVASVTTSTDIAVTGVPILLTASGVADTDGSVTSVTFYREANNTPGLQSDAGDLLLDTDATAADGWSTVATTYGLAPGAYTYYARATDDAGGSGAPATTTQTLIPPLTGSITGTLFHDLDGDSARDPGEPALADAVVFLDTNNNNLLDSGETSTTTDAAGAYTFANLPAGRYTVAQLPPAGWSRTTPAAPPPPVWVEKGPTAIVSGVNGSVAPNGLVTGRVTAIASHPTDALTYYIGSAGGGVWKTTNGGASWTPLTDDQASLPIGAIAISPSNPNVIYAGTGDGFDFSGKGILKSTDAGQTWTLLGGQYFSRRAFWRIVIDPLDPNVAYAGVRGANDAITTGNRGIWKTADGGITWVNTFANIDQDASVTDVIIDPTDHRVLYAALGQRAGTDVNGVYKSTDAGATWTLLDNLAFGPATGTFRLAIANDGHTLYAAISTNSATSTRLLGFFQSTDAGATWTRRLGTPDYLATQGFFATVLAVDPNNPLRVYAGGSGRIFSDAIIRSDDGGITWKSVGTWKVSGSTQTIDWPHVDHHAMAFDAVGRFLDGNDGGIWRTADRGANWTDLNANLNLTQFVGVAVDPANRNLIYGGSQDNGTEKSTGSTLWNHVAAGDGGFVRIDPSNPNTVYHTFFYLKGQTNFFKRSDDAGATWTTKTTGINTSTGGGVFYPPYIFDPANSARLLLGLDKLYESTNRADSWTAISPVLVTGKAITAVAVAPTAPNTIYLTYDDGSVWRTTDHGANWTNVTPPAIVSGTPALAAAAALRLDEDPTGGDEIEDDEDGGREESDASGPGNGNLLIDPTDPLTLYQVRGFYGGAHVLRSTDGGANWTDISADLPDAPTSAIAIDPRTPIHTLYVGNTIGVYVSTDAGAHWTRFGAGLANADVTSLELSTAGNFLTAGTFGRGAWQVALTSASVGAVGVTVAPGQDVQLAPLGAQHYPTLTASQFDYTATNHLLRFTFSRDLPSAPLPGAIAVINLASGAELKPALSYDSPSRTVTLTFASALPDGRYRATLRAVSLADASGNMLDGNADGTAGDNATFDFFTLTGDANRDGAVDFLDLAILAQNYNTAGKAYAQGDFNYDGTVDFLDLALLAQRYNTALPAAPGGAPSASGAVSISSAPVPSLAWVGAVTPIAAKNAPVAVPKPKPAVSPTRHASPPVRIKIAPVPIAKKISPLVVPPLFSAKKITVTPRKRPDVLV